MNNSVFDEFDRVNSHSWSKNKPTDEAVIMASRLYGKVLAESYKHESNDSEDEGYFGVVMRLKPVIIRALARSYQAILEEE